jgi:hypothetical protein
VGSRAVLLCAAYPFAIFFGLPYTESMFLLACCAATYRYLSGRYAEAMLWGILAGLTRPNGSLLALLLGLLWLRQAYDLLRRDGPRDAWPARVFVSGVAACGPLFGMAIYSAYIYGMTGDPFLWATVQQGWGRGTANPIVVLGQLSMELVQSPLTTVAQRPFDLLNGLAGLVALGVVVPIGRRLGWPFAMFVLMGVLLPLTVGGLPSLGRYTAVLFPLFIYGAAISSGRTFTALLTIGVIAQGLVAALFFTWRPIY